MTELDKAQLLVPVGTLWRHKKTGGAYRIVGHCMLEAEWKPAVLYQSADPLGHDRWIARDADEFCDGRFELLNPAME